jgi:disulfide bond formation protein DsbB
VSLRSAGVLTALLALAVLGVVYWAQDFQGLYPCPLCLWERWPYRVVAVLGLLSAVLPRAGRGVLALAALALLAGAGIAALHVGVEMHWWPSPLPECNSMLTPGAALPMLPAKPCDEPVYLFSFLPVSMAAMDFCAAVVFCTALVIYLGLNRRRAL